MPETQLAAQLYTLRDFLKTPADIARTLPRVAEIGYRAVQLSALGPIPATDLRGLLDAAGLVGCATHVAYPRLQTDLPAVVAEHRVLGCDYLAIGSMPADYRNAAGYPRFAREASEIARALRAEGIAFGYHNHSFELERFGDRTGLEILYSESDPEVFCAEIDTYWIQHGGGDPAWWIRRAAGRVPVVHLKDMAIHEGKPVMAEVGEGNLNWPAILEACREAGVRWYVVEQDTCLRDPFESLAISLRNLRSWGLS